MVDQGATDANAIKITIRQSSGDQFEVEIDPASTVLQLKQKCSEKIELAPESQRLIYKGKSLAPFAVQLEAAPSL